MPAAGKSGNTSLNGMTVLLFCAGLWAFSGLASAGALYKWIDESGQIRYSDRLPPAQSQKKHQQLNSQGVVLSTREAAKSKEELAAAAEAKRKEEQQQAVDTKLKQAQDKKDRVLLLTFSNEDELGLTRIDRIEVLDSVIQLINKSITSTQQKLSELQIRAEKSYISKGNDVPGGLAQKIEHFTRKIESRSSQLELKMFEKKKINEQYELDLARYRHLKFEETQTQ